jgi:hypothetical protein
MRCCISSIALVLLKTGIIHHPNGERPVEIDYAQMTTAQKLLLFWRKPAVGCDMAMCSSPMMLTMYLTAKVLVGRD